MLCRTSSTALTVCCSEACGWLRWQCRVCMMDRQSAWPPSAPSRFRAHFIRVVVSDGPSFSRSRSKFWSHYTSRQGSPMLHSY
eukprot:3481118-Pleurochrysis_carterae.AAC.1